MGETGRRESLHAVLEFFRYLNRIVHIDFRDLVEWERTTHSTLEFPDEIRIATMIISTTRILLSMVACAFIFNPVACAFDDPWMHANSHCAHWPSHGAQPNLTLPGGYSICEPYIPDFSLNDFSATYDVWDGHWSDGPPIKVTSGRLRRRSDGVRIIQNNTSRPKLIINPFCKEETTDGQQRR